MIFRTIREIRDLLREVRDALVPPVAEPSEQCQHPDDRRVDLRSIGEREHWICLDCKTEHVA